VSFAARRDTLRALLPQAGELDALLVTDLVDVRYLTGFTGSNAALLVGHDGVDVLGTDGRYRLQAAAEVPDLIAVIDRNPSTALVGELAGRGVGRLGFESDVLTVDAHAALVAAAGPVVWQRAPGLVQRLRAVKDEREVSTLRAACAAADAAWADLLATGGIRPGRTEQEVALDLELRMRGHGADGPAFELIVAAGANSARPHHRPSGVELRRGELVTLDFGAIIEGYHCDMTRTVVLGPAAQWQRELHALVRAAQEAGCAALVPGTEAAAVDAAARAVIDDAGHGADYPHGLGHGVGLRIHEAPALGPTGRGTVAVGMTVTIEPGVYLAGRGGVRIEDTMLVRQGHPEPLTRAGRDLLEL